MRASFYTFGCKLNQFETEALASSFRRQGFSIVRADQEADVYIINTCTVTSKSEQKARRLIRKLARMQSDSLLIVTGCYAQLNRDALSALSRNVVIVPQEKKDTLLELPRFIIRGSGFLENKAECFNRFFSMVKSNPEAGGQFRFQVDKYSFHSRAFLKIQDGCNYCCAYCRIPLARGRSVSLSPEAVLSRIQMLEESGYSEVVLTGVNITAYNSENKRLADLLEQILSGTSKIRFRLSSLEPEMIDRELVEILQDQRICPHFHIPVQSGSDKILSRMRRRYRAERVLRSVSLLRQAKLEAFIAADIIVGFPGETGEDFQLTKILIEELQFSKLHVFPFSPRPGTEADEMKERVPERIRDERVKELISCSKSLYESYIKSWYNKKLDVVLEIKKMTADGLFWQGISENYLKILVSGLPPALARSGKLVRVLIDTTGDPCRGYFSEYV